MKEILRSIDKWREYYFNEKWTKIRKQGRTKYVLKMSLLFGMIIAGALCINEGFSIGGFIVKLIFGFLIGGLLIADGLWAMSEKQYQKIMNRKTQA